MKPEMPLAVLMIALFACGCNESDPDVPPLPIPETVHIVSSSDYLNNRFFRLDLAPGDAGHWHDQPGRSAGQQISMSSIKVFKMLPAGEMEPDDIANIAAYEDTTGVFWNCPDCPPNDFQSPVEFGTRWREISFDPMLDADGAVIGIDLSMEAEPNDVLAVAYVIRDVNGLLVFEVGDQLEYGPVPTVVLPGQSGRFYRLKLLKSPELRPSYAFLYVMRNFYSLGQTQIDAPSFRLALERIDNSLAPAFDENGIPYIRIFGLDQRNFYGGSHPDGLVDTDDTSMIDLSRGLVRFPMEQPFNARREVYEAFADTFVFQWDHTFLSENHAPQIYDPDVLPSYYPRYGRFRLRATYHTAQDSD